MNRKSWFVCLFVIIFIGCIGAFLCSFEKISYHVKAWRTSGRLDDDRDYFDNILYELQPEDVSILQETIRRPRISEYYGNCIVGSAILIYGSEADFSDIAQHYVTTFEQLGWRQKESDYESLFNFENRETVLWEDSHGPWISISIYSSTIPTEAQHFRLSASQEELDDWGQIYHTTYFVDVRFADPHPDCFW